MFKTEIGLQVLYPDGAYHPSSAILGSLRESMNAILWRYLQVLNCYMMMMFKVLQRLFYRNTHSRSTTANYIIFHRVYRAMCRRWNSDEKHVLN